MHKAHIEDMAKTWNQFMKGLEARAKAGGPEHLRTLRALRSHYRRMGQELAEERKKLGMSQERLAKTTGIDQAERLEKIAEVDPEHYAALTCMGVALGLRRNLGEELEKLEQAISLDMEAWDAYFWKGMTCAYLGRYTAASEAIDKALELDLPPVLLTPLYWLERDRPDFFREYARPLLEKYGV